LAGCGGTDAGSSVEPASVGSMESGSISSDSAVLDQKSAEQYLTRNSSISLQGSDVGEMTNSVILITEEFSGVVSQQDMSNESERRYSTITVRVPDAELETYLDRLATLGEVIFLSTSTLDVTTTVIDLDARIETLNTSIITLTKLQSEAASIADLVAVESELTARTAERDSLVAQREFLQEQIDMSTVYISIAADPGATINSPNFVQGVQDGWNALINTFAAAITFAGFLLPLLTALAVIVVVVAAIRGGMKRVRQRS
jgi:hypothetical protein